MAQYKVSYFPSKGGAEIIRMVLSAAGKEFEDERLTREEWLKVKADSPFGAMPLLTETKDGKNTVYCQSGAIAKSLARQFGLAGDTTENQLLVDEVYDCIIDVQREIVKVIFEKDESKKAELNETFRSDIVPKLANYIKKRQTEYGENGYIIGSKMTIADIMLFNFVNQTADYGFDGMWDRFDVIKANESKIKSEKNIAAWLDKRPA